MLEVESVAMDDVNSRARQSLGDVAPTSFMCLMPGRCVDYGGRSRHGKESAAHLGARARNDE